MSKHKKHYTISTYCWDNIDDLKKQMVCFIEQDSLNPNTRIFEVVSEVEWKPDIKTTKTDCELW